ncbi:MAG: CapA family protein [Planctomycetota bacterium]
MGATLAFIGDVMLGRGVNGMIGAESPEWFWGDTLEILRSADAVIANLECAITSHRRPWLRTPKVFHFAADPPAAAVLQAAGVDYVSLANNHVLDFETEGLLDTLHHLDEAGIARAGAGATWAEAAAAAVIEAGEVTVGILSATDNEPAFAAGGDSPGTYYMRIAPNPATLQALDAAIDDLRRRGADLVVLSLHWGPNRVTRPPETFRRFAQAALDCGVDVIHGHSAHIFQGVAVSRGRPILYDTGDFIDDYAIDPDLHNDWSFLFLLDLEDRRPRRLRMLPVELDFARVRLATGHTFQAIRERMTLLCEALDTDVTATDQGLEIALGQPPRSEASHGRPRPG